MNSCLRRPMRSRISSLSPAKCKKTALGTSFRRSLRYEFFNAEHATTDTCPFSKFLRVSEPTAWSQPNRSLSVSGLPWRIFSRFFAGCRSSPSKNSAPSASANIRPTVVLPTPETPITMTGGNCCFVSFCLCIRPNYSHCPLVTSHALFRLPID